MSLSYDQLVKLATQSNSSENFNQIMQQLQQLQLEEEKKLKSQSQTDKLEKLLSDLAKQSKQSKDAFPLMKAILELAPLMDEVESLQEKIKDSDQITLFLKYQSVIKQFTDNAKECEQLSKDGLKGKIDPQKMEQVKLRVKELLSKIKQLHTASQKSTQRYLLWMDKNAHNNFETLAEIQRQYSGFVLVQYYDNDQKFRKDLLNLQDQPCIIMLSGVAAGPNTQWGDGDHFNFIKNNKQNLRIQGCVIYCGQQGYINLKHLLNDESKLLKGITISEQELLQIINKLLVPSEFKRVVLLEHVDFFIPTLKKELLNIGLNDYSTFDISRLNPQKKNLKKSFQKVKELIIKKKIQVKQEVLDSMMNIPDAVQKCFDGETTNKQIAGKVLRLYSDSNSLYPVYNFLNTTMNILNEEIVFLLKEFYFIFILSLYHYDDSGITNIKPDGQPTTLFRGSAINIDHFNLFIKQGNVIVLPSFSSFTTAKNKAIPFIMSNTYDDSVPVLFEFQYKTGNQLYQNRPKNISAVSFFPDEDEYIVYPFYSFIITKIEEFQLGVHTAYNIKLSMQ